MKRKKPTGQRNYGLGLSLNYVDPNWLSYGFEHTLNLVEYKFAFTLTQQLLCSCGAHAKIHFRRWAKRSAREKTFQEIAQQMWKIHEYKEQRLKDFWELQQYQIDEARARIGIALKQNKDKNGH